VGPCARPDQRPWRAGQEAGPSKPVEVLGFQGTPRPATVRRGRERSRAREITEYRQRQIRDKAARQSGTRGSLEQMMTRCRNRQPRSSRSGQGRRAGLGRSHCAGAIEKLGTDEVKARIIHSGAGGITESDISAGRGLGAPIIGFNVRANKQARDAAEREGIEIRYYNIIYDLVDDIKAAMSGMLSPERRETFLGNAEILEVFNITKVGKVAGCRSPKARSSVARRPPDPRQRRHPRRQAQDAQALQGRSEGGQSAARNAAWPSRTTRTSAQGRRHRVLPRRSTFGWNIIAGPSQRMLVSANRCAPPDLQVATAYVTPLGVDDHAETIAALNKNARFIRGRVSPDLRQMRNIPELRFRDDTSFENYSKIDALLRSPEVARDLDHDDDADETGDGAGSEGEGKA
jgi:ribosome-binding factor A